MIFKKKYKLTEAFDSSVPNWVKRVLVQIIHDKEGQRVDPNVFFNVDGDSFNLQLLGGNVTWTELALPAKQSDMPAYRTLRSAYGDNGILYMLHLDTGEVIVPAATYIDNKRTSASNRAVRGYRDVPVFKFSQKFMLNHVDAWGYLNNKDFLVSATTKRDNRSEYKDWLVSRMDELKDRLDLDIGSFYEKYKLDDPRFKDKLFGKSLKQIASELAATQDRFNDFRVRGLMLGQQILEDAFSQIDAQGISTYPLDKADFQIITDKLESVRMYLLKAAKKLEEIYSSNDIENAKVYVELANEDLNQIEDRLPVKFTL